MTTEMLPALVSGGDQVGDSSPGNCCVHLASARSSMGPHAIDRTVDGNKCEVKVETCQLSLHRPL